MATTPCLYGSCTNHLGATTQQRTLTVNCARPKGLKLALKLAAGNFINHPLRGALATAINHPEALELAAAPVAHHNVLVLVLALLLVLVPLLLPLRK